MRVTHVTSIPNIRLSRMGQLALTVAAGAIASGYGRGAYAGTCAPVGVSTYVCSGAPDAAADVEQMFNGGDLVITTDPGFGLDNAAQGGEGFDIDAPASLNFDGSAPGTVRSTGNAIDVDDAAGDVTIDTTGLEITSLDGDGIEVFDATAEGDITITTGDITAEDDAVQIDHRQLGTIEVDTTGGAITSLTGDGVEVDAGYTGDVVVTTGDLNTAAESVDFDLELSGDGTIDTTAGTITSVDQEGVVVFMTESGDITVTTADINASEEGIQLNSFQSEDVTIDTSAGTVTSAASDGIRATNEEGGNTTIITGAVDGDNDGIEANIDEAASLDIDSTAGAVIGRRNEGIDVDSYYGGDARITTSDVTGGETGVQIDFESSGNLDLDTSAGAVEGQEFSGVYTTAYDSGDISVTTADVTGQTFGIDLEVSESGDVTIDTTAGDVTGTTASGIYARVEYSGDVDIDTDTVTGAGAGILLEVLDGYGSDIDIDSDGTVTSLGTNGIEVDLEDTFRLDIDTLDVTGATNGIQVEAYEVGTIIVDTSGGTVTGESEAGIDLYAYGGSSVGISTRDVFGQTYGILATAEDTFNLTIDTSFGDVVGIENVGISAYARGNYSLQVLADDVTGGQEGVYVGADATDLVAVTTTGGAVTGQTGNGIEVEANDARTIDVKTAAVTGAVAGVTVSGTGVTDPDIFVDTTAGLVQGGTVGLAVENDGGGRTAVAVGDVTAGDTGVVVDSENGNVDVDIVGTVTAGLGLDTTLVEDGDLGTFVLISGQVIGTGGTAMQLGDGIHNVVIFDALAAPAALSTFGAGPKVQGDTIFGLSDDRLTFGIGEGTSGVFSGDVLGLFDGGDGTDTVFFDVALTSLFDVRLLGNVLEFDFADALNALNTISFRNFELFSFGDPDVLFSDSDVLAFARDDVGVAPIPLPAGGVLLGSGVALLAWSRRRSRQTFAT